MFKIKSIVNDYQPSQTYNTKLKSIKNHYVPFNNTNFFNQSPIVIWPMGILLLRKYL